MTRKTLQVSLMMLASLALTQSADAEMLVGWDFSQWQAAQYMDTDSSFAYKNTLEANYSDFDQTDGAGRGGVASGSPCPDSANSSCQYGTAYWNGSFGSTDLPESPAFSVNGDFQPLGGSLTSNFDAPGSVDFDSFSVLGSEGQLFTNALRMNYRGSAQADIVFAVDVSSQGPFTDWELIFGGNTQSGASLLKIAFATSLNAGDPVFGTEQDINLSTTDTKFTVDLDGAGTTSDMAWIRFRFEGTESGNTPNIDNVSVFATLVPEPGTALLLMAGLLGLGLSGRQRCA